MTTATAPGWAWLQVVGSTFAVVGVLLVYVAATYERQATRARSLAHSFHDLR